MSKNDKSFYVFITYACGKLYFHLFLFFYFYQTAHDKQQHIETNPERGNLK